jgi:hypothetical protein
VRADFGLGELAHLLAELLLFVAELELHIVS